MSNHLNSSLSPTSSTTTGVTSSVSTSVSFGESRSVSSKAANPSLAMLSEDTAPRPEPFKEKEQASRNDLSFTYVISSGGIWEEPTRTPG